MIKVSRKLALALAAAAAIPATFAIAATVQHAAWHQMTPETRARLDEGRLAMIKTALKLSPDQEKLWVPVETQVRDSFKARDAKRAERDASQDATKDETKRPDMSERFDKMSKAMGERSDRMKAFAGAFKPLYTSLNDEQKDVLRPLIHAIAPGMGHKGHGHRFGIDRVAAAQIGHVRGVVRLVQDLAHGVDRVPGSPQALDASADDQIRRRRGLLILKRVVIEAV